MQEALLRNGIEAAQFEKRLGVIIGIDPQPGIILVAVDDERCRLAAALVAACRLARVHGIEQAFGKRYAACSRFILDTHRLGNHLRSRQHVARNRDVAIHEMTGPIDAVFTGESGVATMGVDEVHLPLAVAVVARS